MPLVQCLNLVPSLVPLILEFYLKSHIRLPRRAQRPRGFRGHPHKIPVARVLKTKASILLNVTRVTVPS
jgi:hypothetical protein